MIKCPHCGAMNSASVIFCVTCQTNVHWIPKPNVKNCDGCGFENPSDATHCQKCGVGFESAKAPDISPVPAVSESEGEQISTSAKWWILLVTWATVAFLSMVPYPSQVLMAPFFPLGLLALSPDGEKRAITGCMQGFPILLIGWGFYLFLMSILFKARKKDDFLPGYILFCVVLVLNVYGCKKTLSAVAGIH